MNDALLIQQVYPSTGKDPLLEMSQEYMDLNVSVNGPYCERHGFDYWHVIENLNPDKGEGFGSWGKVVLLQKGLEAGYKYVVWLDVDTVIWRRDIDLREACTPDHIGVCWHRIPQLHHWNVGAGYYGNSERVRKFVADWLSHYPTNDGWAEQGVFNKLARQSDIVQTISDRWNATLHYSEVPDPVVLGFHGDGDPKQRFLHMQEVIKLTNEKAAKELGVAEAPKG
jgi:hypothetical protein